jgi:hypothetical protein
LKSSARPGRAAGAIPSLKARRTTGSPSRRKLPVARIGPGALRGGSVSGRTGPSTGFGFGELLGALALTTASAGGLGSLAGGPELPLRAAINRFSSASAKCAAFRPPAS